MGIRKNVLYLTPTEKSTFLKAVLRLKNTIANPSESNPDRRISLYDQFVALHTYVTNISVNGGLGTDKGHTNSAFLPWHRCFILRYEQALNSVLDPGERPLTLPYWDWTDPNATAAVFDPSFMGPLGSSGSNSDVTSGYFAYDAPGTGSNPTTPPSWWPAGLVGWRIRSDLDIAYPPPTGASLVEGTTLRRNQTLGLNATNLLSDLGNVLNIGTYEDTANTRGFRLALEAGNMHDTTHTPTTLTRVHGEIHGAVGGHMTYVLMSPNDPIFFLHHCNVDRIWAMWQINGHSDPTVYYPATGRPQGHNLNDMMWPWVGNSTIYSPSNPQPNIVLPDFSQSVIHPADMLDHRLLGYSYDTEVVIGIAIDQGINMNIGPSIQILGTNSYLTKWDAAKMGVEQMLVDCETIFASNNAYITVGVETFKSLGGINTSTPVFKSVPPYGIVKTGSPYDSAKFDTQIAALTPGGGTSLAAALSDTYSNLVRPPFNNNPPNDTRYLAILTAGIETSQPYLSSLGHPAFPNTMIYAMGFGLGVSGLNYNLLADLVNKGETAPLVGPTGPIIIKQVYHGESQDAIDKFYTDTIARAINYTSTIDPIYELFPGECVHTAFDVTDEESSFMITAQGYDFEDKNWDFCLVRPDGEHCANTTKGMHHHDKCVMELDPFHVTSRKKKGRCTIILNRGGADASLWVGRWNLMIMYKMALGMAMYMPLIGRIILPTGSLPVRGPLYSRLNNKPRMMHAVRVIPGLVTDPGIQTDQAPSTISNDACAVSVNIYSKTTIQSTLEVDIKDPYAGNDFTLILKVSDNLSIPISNLKVIARLVAPRYSVGNAFADLKNISLDERKKYLAKSINEFNEVQYLADYEQKQPGVFPVRDEIVIFKKADNGNFYANVGNNLFPGVYRIGVYVEGTILGRDQKPQRFTRILQTDVALGINPDPENSKPSLSWISSNKFVVSVTPTDKLGNIASPSMTAPVITVNGIPVKGEHVNPFTGEHQVEVTLEGKGIKFDSAGKLNVPGEATMETGTYEKLGLKEGQKFDVGILISGRMLVSGIQYPTINGNKGKMGKTGNKGKMGKTGNKGKMGKTGNQRKKSY